MTFDELDTSIKALHEYVKTPAHHQWSIDSMTIHLYVQGSPGHRARLRLGFPKLPEALSMFHTRGYKLFVEYDLMKHEEALANGNTAEYIERSFRRLTADGRTQEAAIAEISLDSGLEEMPIRGTLGYLGLL